MIHAAPVLPRRPLAVLRESPPPGDSEYEVILVAAPRSDGGQDTAARLTEFAVRQLVRRWRHEAPEPPGPAAEQCRPYPPQTTTRTRTTP